MAAHLRDAGHELYVHDIAAVPQALIEQGRAVAAERASGRRSAPRSSSSMVPDTPDVAAVLFGADGVADGLSRRARSSST